MRWIYILVRGAMVEICVILSVVWRYFLVCVAGESLCLLYISCIYMSYGDYI